MRVTFNCGIGFILCVDANDSDAILATLKDMNEDAYLIGKIVDGEQVVTYV